MALRKYTTEFLWWRLYFAHFLMCAREGDVDEEDAHSHTYAISSGRIAELCCCLCFIFSPFVIVFSSFCWVCVCVVWYVRTFVGARKYLIWLQLRGACEFFSVAVSKMHSKDILSDTSQT